MSLEVKGMPEIFSMLEDEEILWAVKRRTLRNVAENARHDAADASAAIKDTGYLERNWKYSYYVQDEVATSAVYSNAYHDIYNELGSPTNRQHIGFWSRTVDRNTEKYLQMMEEGILDDKHRD